MTLRRLICGAVILLGVASAGTALAGQTETGDHPEVTFTKDIAPMSLLTYQQARPWARAMKMRTSLGPRAGVMPPWYVETNIGIQHYKNDPSLKRGGHRQDRRLG